jgi:hypothetical protein
MWIAQVGLVVQIVPKTVGSLPNTRQQFSLPFGIAQETAKATRVNLKGKFQEVRSGKFKAFGKQLNNLIDAVEELQENGRYLSFVDTGTIGRIIPTSFSMRTPCMKGMSKTHKVLFHQTGKAFDRSVIGIQ